MINLKEILITLDKNLNNIKKRKFKDFENLNKVIEIYKTRNKKLQILENLKFDKNKISKKSFNSYQVKNINIQKSKKIGIEIFDLKQKLELIEKKLKELLYIIPNIPHYSVKEGKNSNENKIIFVSNDKLKEINVSHDEILHKLNWVQFEEAVKLSHSRFILYNGEGAKLLRILKNYMLDYHIKNSYREIFTPNIVNESTLWGTGQFPKMISDCYKIENENLYLLPTSEVSLISYLSKKLFEENELPLKLCAYSLCFRKEAGAAGKDTKGLIRLHQFNKVEIVQIVEQEKSYEALEEMLEQVVGILKDFKIPYRIVSLCTGDLGFTASKTYDVEVWMPSKKKYIEISSISNTETFQSNNLNIKYINNEGKKKLTHTLNGSGLAIDRLIAVLSEHYYIEKTNTFVWPEVLKKYLNF